MIHGLLALFVPLFLQHLNKETQMHYRNGREAKNGDRIVQLTWDGRIAGVGILYDAVAGNDYCNGNVAPICTAGACIIDCLLAEDVTAFLVEKGLDKRTMPPHD